MLLNIEDKCMVFLWYYDGWHSRSLMRLVDPRDHSSRDSQWAISCTESPRSASMPRKSSRETDRNYHLARWKTFSCYAYCTEKTIYSFLTIRYVWLFTKATVPKRHVRTCTEKATQKQRGFDVQTETREWYLLDINACFSVAMRDVGLYTGHTLMHDSLENAAWDHWDVPV